ncbi:MAG: hypothetical protein AAB573_01445 [Patescibacteria group bacterium]
MSFTAEHVFFVCREDKPDQCAYLGSKMNGSHMIPVCMRGVPQIEHAIAGINEFHKDRGGAQINCTGDPEYLPLK